MMEKNEEEIKEVKEEIKTIQAIFSTYSSERWEFLRFSSSFRQEVEKEFHRFGPYSFDQLKLKKSKLQDEKNLLLDREILLFRKTEPGIKSFHFLTVNDI